LLIRFRSGSGFEHRLAAGRLERATADPPHSRGLVDHQAVHLGSGVVRGAEADNEAEADAEGDTEVEAEQEEAA
jgi:hypothetical protein